MLSPFRLFMKSPVIIKLLAMRKRKVISLKTCAKHTRPKTIVNVNDNVDKIPLMSRTRECYTCSLIVAPEANALRKHAQVSTQRW